MIYTCTACGRHRPDKAPTLCPRCGCDTFTMSFTDETPEQMAREMKLWPSGAVFGIHAKPDPAKRIEVSRDGREQLDVYWQQSDQGVMNILGISRGTGPLPLSDYIVVDDPTGKLAKDIQKAMQEETEKWMEFKLEPASRPMLWSNRIPVEVVAKMTGSKQYDEPFNLWPRRGETDVTEPQPKIDLSVEEWERLAENAFNAYSDKRNGISNAGAPGWEWSKLGESNLGISIKDAWVCAVKQVAVDFNIRHADDPYDGEYTAGKTAYGTHSAESDVTTPTSDSYRPSTE